MLSMLEEMENVDRIHGGNTQDQVGEDDKWKLSDTAPNS